MNDRSFRAALRLATVLACLLAFGAADLLPLAAGPASAQTEEELLKLKANWQERYRRLLTNRAILKNNVAKARKNYAQAQRRNYPRGGAREQFLLDAAAAEKELVGVEEEIEQIFVDARREGIVPGWLYEVDDEPIAVPAAADGADDAPDDGRNPLYANDEEAEAKPSDD